LTKPLILSEFVLKPSNNMQQIKLMKDATVALEKSSSEEQTFHPSICFSQFVHQKAIPQYSLTCNTANNAARKK